MGYKVEGKLGFAACDLLKQILSGFDYSQNKLLAFSSDPCGQIQQYSWPDNTVA